MKIVYFTSGAFMGPGAGSEPRFTIEGIKNVKDLYKDEDYLKPEIIENILNFVRENVNNEEYIAEFLDYEHAYDDAKESTNITEDDFYKLSYEEQLELIGKEKIVGYYEEFLNEDVPYFHFAIK